MAFKMTPGIKGNPANSSMMNGGCGGDGQPPCPPRFQAEKITAPVEDRSSRSRSKAIRAKKKVAAPAPAPIPVKLKLNVPLGHRFISKEQEIRFYATMEKAIANGEFKSQEELDKAVKRQLKPTPIVGVPGVEPVRPKPVERPGLEAPVLDAPVLKAPVKGVAAKIAK